MKIKLTYYVKHEEIIEIDPKEYGEIHAKGCKKLCPENAKYEDYSIYDEKSKMELYDFWDSMKN